MLGKGDRRRPAKSYEQALAIRSRLLLCRRAVLPTSTSRTRSRKTRRKRFEGVLAADPKNVQALIAIASLQARAGAKTGRSRRADQQGD